MTRHSVDTLRKACLFLAGTLATFSQGPARAQCTATSNAPTATCTGDLSSGVFLENIGQTTVTDLTAPITSGITVLNGWYLPDNAPDDQPGQAGPPGSLGFSDPNYGVSTIVQPGLEIFVGGQDGGNGSGTATSGNPGQSGGVGGTATLTVSAPSLAGSAGPQQPGGIVTVQSQGGSGGNGYIPPQQSEGSDDSTLTGGAGGIGGAGGAASLTVSVPSVTLTGDGTAILVQSSGGNGGGGSEILSWGSSFGGNGGKGGHGGAAAADIDIGQFTVTGGTGAGVLVQSLGGAGSAGTSAAYLGLGSEYGSQAGNGGDGDDGGSVQVTGSATMTVQATGPFDAIRAESIGGAGGGGGNANNPTYAVAGNGGVGGAGGTASIGTASAPFSAEIAVTGDNARGIYARSVGAAGGDGGSVAGTSVVAENGAAFGSGHGGAASVYLAGSVATSGAASDAIIAQSVGGFSGAGGFGASLASAGAGGDVTLALSLSAGSGAAVTTQGDTADAVVAQSVGGGGGNAYDLIEDLTALGGAGQAGGDGGTVSVQIAGSAGIATSGRFARGVYADSVGSGGGNAGPNTGITGLGATGGTGGSGAAVAASVAVPIVTTGDYADGIVIASRGGGGGSATSTSGFESIGGQTGGGAGSGGQVSLVLSGAISTAGIDADAVFLQSVGGGGGDGGGAAAIGAFYARAIGGAGGGGGNGGDISFSPPAQTAQPQITTTGDRSRGVLAQSIGGGGGNGGDATTVVAGGISYAHTVGGKGGSGGSGGTATLTVAAPISTQGAMSDGVLAQSVGGGGGVGGSVIAVTVDDAFGFSQTVGGNGANGGTGGAVNVTTTGGMATAGTHANGVLAQSVGGGGGHAGSVISGSVLSDLSVDLTVGGGGGGQAASTVTVDTSGAIQTQGDGAKGILAQSVGGGGGNASSNVNSTGALDAAKLSVSVGGAGGAGSNGEAVAVTAGAITTAGKDSAALAALSIGGGGGAGSSVVNANAVTLGPVNYGIAGGGGKGGAAGTVTVTANGDIATTGMTSEGIFALSAGGYGGMSGTSVVGVANVDMLSAGSINVTVGGSGGAGGSSSDVAVTTHGNLSTGGAGGGGTHSTAILAQSVAGGGGRALGSVSASAVDVGTVQVTLGGGGGTGGQAGKVSVDTAAGTRISTDGVHAAGIAAQSLGGAGGTGGFAAELSANVSAGSNGVSGQVGVTLGGAGAAGGSANDVDINNAAAISTGDYGSRGIFAQSIGGDGGAGGSVYAGNLDISSTASINVDVNIGGDGGGGSTSGNIDVVNTGVIATDGYHSTALMAQTIGGSGGAGGSSRTIVAQLGPAAPENITVSLGGAGGGSAVAGNVALTNKAAITTQKGGSDGIFGQSIGGSGGSGGSTGYIGVDLTPPVKYEDSGFPLQISVNVGRGGDGKAGANAGAVTIDNEAAITTAGNRSRGIFAQSIGGGGGDGGTASATAFAVSDICKLGNGTYVCPSGDDEEETTNVSISSTVQIGGDGGGSGNGGAVTVTNSGAITTAGNVSHAIYAQSVGGGGGVGGDGSLGLEAWTSNTILNNLSDIPSNFLPSFNSFDVAIGGAAGAAGDGGTVRVTNTGDLLVKGQDPSVVTGYSGASGLPSGALLPLLHGGMGIFAQSVGGGGGDGGAGSSGLSAKVTVGRGGGGGGNGGDVTVTNSGAITTWGFSGAGILAQSVGGGGGTAGDVGLGFADSWTGLNIGAGLGIQEDAGNGGNGGKVTVTSSGAIVTNGQAAHGIIAQSVGGSGGMAGLAYSSAATTMVLVGSRGARGNGGDVTVNVNAPITVNGTGSVGVAAHSAGGIGSGDASGAVAINVNDRIAATGSGGRGMLVGSASYQNQATGKVTIGIAADATVSTGAQGAETVGVFGAGAGSSLQNHGTITSGNAASYAVRVSSPFTFSVQNDGTISGSISGTDSSAITGIHSDQLPTDGGVNGAVFGVPSSIDLLNKPGGVVNAGLLLDVSHLTNQGTLAVGGQGQIGSTRLTGNLSQVDGGVLAVDLNPGGAGSNGLADQLSIDGRADLGGRVVVNVVDPWQPMAGTQSVLILTADEGLTYGELEHAQSAVAQYRFIEPSPGVLHLGYDIDFANPGILAATNDNQDGIAHHLHGIYRSQALDPGMARDLIAIEDQGSYARVMNTLGAELAVNNQTVSLLSTIAFNDALLSCAERTGDYRFFDQGQCGWLRLRGQRFTQRETHDNLGFDADSWQLAGGGQIDVGDDWHLGAALSYEGRGLNADDSNASSDGGQFQAGVSAKRRWGATELSGSLAMGYGDFDNDRALWPGVAVSGTQKLWLFSGQVRIAHLLQWGRWALKPRLDLGVDYLSMDAFNESGTTDLRQRIDGQSDTYVNLQPAIDIATDIETANGLLLRPKLTLGITQFLGNTSPAVSGRFAAAPGNVPSFTASTGLDQTRFDVAAAVDIFTRSDLMIRAEVFGSFSDNSESYGGGLKIGKEF